MTASMAALYFHALGPNDRVAVKPHAGPVLHAIHYLLGRQSREQLENFRGSGGMQSYPSRTKDRIPVDFSTGSVGSSEERCVGKEGVRTCSSSGSPIHLKKDLHNYI